MIFTRCVSGFQHEGENLKLVDKPVGRLPADGELEIDLLDQADAAAIVSAVINFSGMGREGAGNGQTFQTDGERNDESTPARNCLPMPAESVP